MSARNLIWKEGITKRLVCSIEILSLTNKTRGEKGLDLYRQKQQERLDSQTHLVEIDLLRAGHHTTAVPLDRAREEGGSFDYHVCVRRFNRSQDFEVYPILLQQPLPTVGLPLMPGDGDVDIRLQDIFARAYETGPYERIIDYRIDPVKPPLTPEQESWMRDVLRRAGMSLIPIRISWRGRPASSKPPVMPAGSLLRSNPHTAGPESARNHGRFA